jgi:hypothetical protein
VKNRCYGLAMLLSWLCLSSAQAQTAPDSLGTLLFSPAERSAITAARVAQQSSGFNFDTSLSVKGLVKRGASKGTSWINGQTITEGRTITSGSVPVIGTKEISVEGRSVRVGETLDLESGTRVDLIPQGSVSVRRQK